MKFHPRTLPAPTLKFRPAWQGAGALRLLAVCLLAGCAAEAPPRPPRIQTPERVRDLTAAQSGERVALSLTLPQLATDGRRLTKPVEIEIFRRITPPGAGAAAALVTAKPWVTIQPQDLGRFEHGSRFEYAAGPPSDEFGQLLGSTLSFTVVTLTRGFRGHPHESDPSNLAEATLLNVSRPVEGVQLRQAPRAIELTWRAPVQGVVSSAPLPEIQGYRVYRSEGQQPTPFKMLAEVRSPSYADAQIQIGKTYVYDVSAVFGHDGATAISSDSAAVGITPRAIFPPPPPTGLTAVATGRSVELIWTPEAEPDLAGYNIYRQAPGRNAERLNPHLLRTPAFSDRTASRGQRYAYWVTAVDAAHNESERSTSVAVEAE